MIKDERDYYDKVEYLSQSSLKWLGLSPKYFKKKIDGEIQEEDTKAMTIGRMFHMFILEPDKFNDSVIVLKCDKPSSSQQNKFCETIALYDKNEEEYSITEVYCDVYSCKGKSDSKVEKESSELYDGFKDYIKFLNDSDGKTIITQDEHRSLETYKISLLEHKRANYLLFSDEIITSGKNSDRYKILTEEEIYFKYRNEKCKSKLDKVIIDFKKKVITLIDLKTTGIRLNKFRDSFNEYGYGFQLAFYTTAIYEYMNKNYKDVFDVDEWNVECKIIAIEKKYLNECSVFNINEEDIEVGFVTMGELIDKYKSHKKYGFDFNLEYYTNENNEEQLMTD